MDSIAYAVLGLKITVETIMFLAFGPLAFLACFTTTVSAIWIAGRFTYVYTEAIITTIYECLRDWIFPDRYKMYE